MSLIDDVKKLYELGERIVPPIVEWFKSRNNRTSWESYERIYDIDGFKVPYISLLNGWKSNVRDYDQTNIEVREITGCFDLPEELDDTPIPSGAFNGERCRLAHFDISSDSLLSFTLQETEYFDYLKSGEYLDHPYPGNSKLTNRDAFGKTVREHDGHIWAFENLTNICGVGLLILTNDNYLILTKHSEKSHVYPGRITFSSSGTMKWGGQLNPFDQVAEKCFSELGHRINIKKTKLIGFGADARKLYFQFSFLEISEHDSGYFLAKLNDSESSPDNQIQRVKFNQDELVDKIMDECWEPAAEAAVLTALVLKKNKKDLMCSLFSRKSKWTKRTMKDEWDYRSSKSGLLPVMSVRYPQNRLSSISKEYVDAVMHFIGNEIENKSVVEVGSGIGRITEKLAQHSRNVTCVELCGRMISLSMSRLGSHDNISYMQSFAQDYKPAIPHDAAISSLVLIHNTDENEYEKLIENLCFIANDIYIFEDTNENRETSGSTVVRGVGKLVSDFRKRGFSKIREHTFLLEKDNISFLKFERVVESRS